MFVELYDVNNPNYLMVGRYDGEKVVKLNYNEYHPYGITPKNTGQKMLIESMMHNPNDAPLVIVKGGAGTGKTYQTLACVLEQTKNSTDTDVYEQIIISTSV